MTHITDHTCNGYPLRVRFSRIAKRDFFPDRVLIREPFPGEGLVDDSDLRRIGLVALIEETALDKRDLQDLEIILGHNANLFVRINLLLKGVAALDGERAVAVRSA